MAESSAVVTGATGTLGREVVRLLAAQGRDVIAISRTGESVDGGLALAADLGSDAAIDVIAAAVAGRPVGMVVHAIGLPGGSTVEDLDPALLGEAVNLKAGGFLRLWRAVRSSMGPGSRMIAIGGHLGVEPSEHAPLAGVANAALANLVRQLAGPVGRRGGTVHLVAPGPFESPRVDALIARAAAARGLSSDEVRAEMLAEYPTGRMPSAADVAAIVVELAAPHNSAQNGSTIFADGGIKRSIF